MRLSNDLEPTSGLDTFTAHSIIGLLRDIAHTQGKTIVCTIHQPSSDVFHMFDDLVLLADGEIMYQGDASHCVEYFAQRGLVCPENYNPADYLFHSVLYSMDAQLNMISEDMKHSLQSSSKKGKHLNLNSPTQTDSTMESRQLASKAAYEQMQQDEKKRVASLLQEWLSSKEYSEVQSQISHPLSTRLPDPTTMRAERPGEFYAFQLLSQRRWHDLLRDRMKLRVQFSQVRTNILYREETLLTIIRAIAESNNLFQFSTIPIFILPFAFSMFSSVLFLV